MGLFGRSKKLNNAAAPAVQIAPRPMPTIHQHGPNWAVMVLVGFFCLLALLPVSWWVLVFLLSEAGSSNPTRHAAFLILGLPLFVLAVWLLAGLVDAIGRWVHDTWVDVLHEVNEGKRVELTLAQPALPSGRMTASDKRFAKLIKAVMLKAFDHGPYKYGDAYPWSREQAKAEMVEGQMAGFELGSRVSGFLRQHGVIVKEGTAWQVNRRKFPTMGQIDELLYSLWDVPVSVSPTLTLRENDGYQFIDD